MTLTGKASRQKISGLETHRSFETDVFVQTIVTKVKN